MHRGDVMEALAELYRQHAPGIVGYLRRHFGPQVCADEVLQETFARAAARPDRLAAVESPRAWLFAIARNVAVRDLRRRHRTAPLPEDLPEPSPAEADPRLDRMRRAVESLPPQKRETLDLRLRDGLTYEEIAHVLGIPVGTVRSRLHHTVRELAEALRPPQT
jgi:RNA polymerase sigma-70 factor (ECF subfamily)